MAKPCPDCVLTYDESTKQYKWGSPTTGYKTSGNREFAKNKHKAAYPNAYPVGPTPLTPNTPTPAPIPTPPPKKIGGPITDMGKVQAYYKNKR